MQKPKLTFWQFWNMSFGFLGIQFGDALRHVVRFSAGGSHGCLHGHLQIFIVIPEIVASIALEPVVKQVFNNDPVKVVMLGGASTIVAAALVQLVKDEKTVAT